MLTIKLINFCYQKSIISTKSQVLFKVRFFFLSWYKMTKSHPCAFSGTIVRGTAQHSRTGFQFLRITKVDNHNQTHGKHTWLKQLMWIAKGWREKRSNFISSSCLLGSHSVLLRLTFSSVNTTVILFQSILEKFTIV